MKTGFSLVPVEPWLKHDPTPVVVCLHKIIQDIGVELKSSKLMNRMTKSTQWISMWILYEHLATVILWKSATILKNMVIFSPLKTVFSTSFNDYLKEEMTYRQQMAALVPNYFFKFITCIPPWYWLHHQYKTMSN